MVQYTYEFVLEREVTIDGTEETQTVELTLQAELEIEPFIRGKYSGAPEKCFPDEGGIAEISGSIMIQDEDGNFESWTGELTPEEKSFVEESGYKDWEQNSAEAELDSFEDYDVPDYDDFREDRALIGGCKVFY